MSTTISEYLNLLDDRKSLEVLQRCYSSKGQLIFKSPRSGQMVTAEIVSFHDKKVIISLQSELGLLGENAEVSIKFSIGTEVFFTKTKIMTYMNSFCFDISTRLIELTRRKETRYLIPSKWAQNASILNPSTQQKIIVCRILDISDSGLRLETSELIQHFAIGQVLKIQFSIHKRAEMQYEAAIRFLRQIDQKSLIFGLEFANLKPAQEQKIESIIQDIIQFAAIHKI